MKRKSYKNLILILIFRGQGKWSWYQIERELEWRGIGGKINPVSIIEQLVAEKLITLSIDEKIGPGVPYCGVTENGIKMVEELFDRYGIEPFETKFENKDDYE